MALEFEEAWLEVSACKGGQAGAADGSLLEVPAISEVLEAAASANGHPGLWDYSRRLYETEIEAVYSALNPRKTAEDSRSVSYSTNITYKGWRYTLTIFAIKRNQ